MLINRNIRANACGEGEKTQHQAREGEDDHLKGVGAGVNQLGAAGQEIAVEDVEHVSPARFTPVNPYGRYSFELDTNCEEEVLRLLRQSSSLSTERPKMFRWCRNPTNAAVHLVHAQRVLIQRDLDRREKVVQWIEARFHGICIHSDYLKHVPEFETFLHGIRDQRAANRIGNTFEHAHLNHAVSDDIIPLAKVP